MCARPERFLGRDVEDGDTPTDSGQVYYNKCRMFFDYCYDRSRATWFPPSPATGRSEEDQSLLNFFSRSDRLDRASSHIKGFSRTGRHVNKNVYDKAFLSNNHLHLYPYRPSGAAFPHGRRTTDPTVRLASISACAFGASAKAYREIDCGRIDPSCSAANRREAAVRYSPGSAV